VVEEETVVRRSCCSIRRDCEEVVEDEYETIELNENSAMEYLAESKGMTLEEFRESLTPREQKKYAPEMEKFNEFIEKTGNTITKTSKKHRRCRVMKVD
jgi:hypothetical protein